MHELGEAAQVWVYLQIFEKLFGMICLLGFLGYCIWSKR